MTEIAQALEIWNGDSKIIEVPITDAETGSAFSLTNAIVRWQVAKSASSRAEVFIRKSTESDDGGISIVAGGVEIQIDRQDTEATVLPPGVYYQELKVYVDNDVSTAMVGWLTVHPALDMDATA